MRGDFSTNKTIDVNFSPTDSSPCGCSTHEFTLMGGGGRASLDYGILTHNQIFLSHNHVGEGVVHHSSDIFEASKPRIDRRRKMMRELICE